jgi:hypothetical protein
VFRIHWKPIKSDLGSNFPESFSRYSNKIKYEFEHTLTGDESWFFLNIFIIRAVPEIPKQEIQSEKCLISIIWGSTRIKTLLYVPKA